MNKILVVEDNKTLRENLAEMLGFSGYKVKTASNGFEGLNEINNDKPDLIICDIMMPKLDGFGLLKILNQNPINKHIPLIFLTAKSDNTDFRKGMGLGAQDYITKPFDDADLLEAISLRLDRNKNVESSLTKGIPKLKLQLTDGAFKSKFEDYYSGVENRNFKAREQIFQTGRKINYAFYIQKGQIRLSQTNKLNKELSHSIKKQGDFFGLVEILQGDTYSCSAFCISNSSLVLIPKQNFFKLLDENSAVQNYLFKILSNRIDELQNESVKIAYNSVRQKVAESLVKLSNN